MSKREVIATTFQHVDMSIGVWRSHLTPEEAARGMLAVQRNVRRLFDDALHLYAGERFATALSLALLAYEEASKCLTLGLIPAVVRSTGVALLWKQFENHLRKAEETHRMHVLAGDFPPEVLEKIREQDSGEMARAFSLLRKRATYVDCVQGPERWSLPESVIDKETVAIFLHATFRAIRRVTTPAQVFGLLPENPMLRPFSSGRRGQRMEALSGSREARALSTLMIKEATEWGDRTREHLSHVPIPPERESGNS